MDAVDVERFRERLTRRQAALVAALADATNARAPIAPDRAIGRLTRQDALQQQQMSDELSRRSEQELSRVRRALAALDEGTYGTCAKCGDSIGIARLNAAPDAVLCLRCAGR